VRAFDLMRYRNFRTFTSPDGLCPFTGVAVDGAGEIVAASTGGDKYAVYVWSIQTSNLLEVLTAHTSEVQTLQFSPSTSRPGQLATAAWDGTVRVWDLYASANKGGAPEALQCVSSVLSLQFDPRGNDICAAACLSGQVQFWNVSTGLQVGSIDGIRDIQSCRQWHDRFAPARMRGIKAGGGLKKGNSPNGLNLNQHFTSIAYARNGELVVCGSKDSAYLCLYDTTSYMLATRLCLTRNMNLSGTQVMVSSKHQTEAGVDWREIDVSDSEADDIDVAKKRERHRQANALPGVNVGEAKDRYSDSELHVWNVAFSPDSQQFAAATTHGVYIFSADMGFGTSSASGGIYRDELGAFAPQMLTQNVSAPAVIQALEEKDLSRAMILALALNDHNLIRKVYEKIPVQTIPLIAASIGAPVLPALLRFLAIELRPSSGTPHFQFHVSWVKSLIDLHFQTLTELVSGKLTSRTGTALEAAATANSDVSALCLRLLVEFTERFSATSKVFNSNIYLLKYLGSVPVGSAEGGTVVGSAEGGSDAIEEIQNTSSSLPPRPSLMEQLLADRNADDQSLGADVANGESGDKKNAAHPKTKKKKRLSSTASGTAAKKTRRSAGPSGGC